MGRVEKRSKERVEDKGMMRTSLRFQNLSGLVTARDEGGVEAIIGMSGGYNQYNNNTATNKIEETLISSRRKKERSIYR